MYFVSENIKLHYHHIKSRIYFLNTELIKTNFQVEIYSDKQIYHFLNKNTSVILIDL